MEQQLPISAHLINQNPSDDLPEMSNIQISDSGSGITVMTSGSGNVIDVVGDISNQSNIQIGHNNTMYVSDDVSAMASTSEGANYISITDESDGKKIVKEEKMQFELSEFPTEMSSEAVRLASYRSWPHSSPVNPSALARAGMFYTKIADMVECFSCHGQIKEWDFGDTAMGEHKRLFPDCAFVNGKDVDNIPLLKPPPPGSSASAETSESFGESTKKGKKKKKKRKKGKKKKVPTATLR